MNINKKILLPLIFLGLSALPVFAGTATFRLQVSAMAGTGAGGSCTV